MKPAPQTSTAASASPEQRPISKYCAVNRDTCATMNRMRWGTAKSCQHKFKFARMQVQQYHRSKQRSQLPHKQPTFA